MLIVRFKQLIHNMPSNYANNFPFEIQATRGRLTIFEIHYQEINVYFLLKLITAAYTSDKDNKYFRLLKNHI